MKNLPLSRPEPKKTTAYLMGIVLCAVLAFALNLVYETCLEEFTHLALSKPRIVLFFGILVFLYLHIVFPPEKLYRCLYRYRFLLAGVLFAVCVALKLHGSSIGVWNNYIASAQRPSPYQFPILGVSRPIRSDEWLVFTPLAMSQQFNGFGIVNDIACAWPTNMLTTYNQPVWDLTVIAKPFYWGYLLLGPEYGLSWFWCGRLIALFLVTFEMFLLITGQKKRYALAAAFLITFSAFVQWWFAINFLVEMLVWGQLAELMLYRFLNTDNPKTKALCTAVFALCALGYLFALYPAWMVPLFYLFAAIALWILLENFSHAHRSLRELWYVAAALTVIGAVAGHWLLVSADAISTTMNTVYPGERFYTGGTGWDHTFFYINNLLLPYRPVLNSCEPAMLYGFFPFTEILVAVYLVKTKFQDKLLTVLGILDVCFLVFFLFGAPAFLAKITLLYLTSNRICPIICIIEVTLYLRLLAVEDAPLVQDRKKRFALLGILFALAAAFVWGAKMHIPADLNPQEGLKTLYCLLMVLLIAAYSGYFFVQRTQRRKTAFTLAAAVLALVTGLFVNPLMRTTDAIYTKPLAQTIRAIQEEAPGTWISTNWVQANFLICNGAPTVNSTNIIPTMERWEKLDPSGAYTQVYNRYAHISVVPAEQTHFELSSNKDRFILYITLEDLQSLGVDYLCMMPGEEFPTEAFSQAAEQIYLDRMIAIYRLNTPTEEHAQP